MPTKSRFLLRKRFRKMLDSPFFGRVDFLYEGDEEPESFLYRYWLIFPRKQGADRWSMTGVHRSADFFMIMTEVLLLMKHLPAIFEGEITSKWQYKIRKGNLVYEFESDVKIDDEILKAELGS